MESPDEVQDRNGVAGALQRGYDLAAARTQELAADATTSPASRYAALLNDGATALDAVGQDLVNLHDELPPPSEGNWEQEALAELGNDTTLDDVEIDRRMATETTATMARDTAMNDRADDARAATGKKLLEHVETVAAHPWKGIDLTSVPGHDTAFNAASRDEVIERLDQLLTECGMTTTKELSQQVAPPKELEVVNAWSEQARDQAAVNKIRNLSFPAGAKLPQPKSGDLAPLQKAKNFLTTKSQRNGVESGR